MLKVFGLVVQANGGSHKVESERGKAYENLDDREQEERFNRRTAGLNEMFTFVDEDPEVQLLALREVFV